MEKWAPILDFPGYSVSNLGRVRRDQTGRILRPKVNQTGVAYVGLMREYDQRQRGLAKMVAYAFLKPQFEAFDTPINLDGNRLNCAVDNLMWRPRWFAVRYHQQFKDDAYSISGLLNGSLRAIDTGELFDTPRAAACRYGLLERDIVLSVLNQTETWPSYMRFEEV
jgi:hypothetical protein